MKRIQLFAIIASVAMASLSSCGGGSSANTDENKGDSTQTVQSDLPGWDLVTDQTFSYGTWTEDNSVITLDVYTGNGEGDDTEVTWKESLDGNEALYTALFGSKCSEKKAGSCAFLTLKTNDKSTCYTLKMYKKGKEAKMLITNQEDKTVTSFSRTIE